MDCQEGRRNGFLPVSRKRGDCAGTSPLVQTSTQTPHCQTPAPSRWGAKHGNCTGVLVTRSDVTLYFGWQCDDGNCTVGRPAVQTSLHMSPGLTCSRNLVVRVVGLGASLPFVDLDRGLVVGQMSFMSNFCPFVTALTPFLTKEYLINSLWLSLPRCAPGVISHKQIPSKTS